MLSIFILGGVNLGYESLQNSTDITKESSYKQVNKVPDIENIDSKDEKIENLLKTNKNLKRQIWQIEIPSIGLIAPINEGTTQEIMREYVGHFENTSLWKGNIGLAAHNRRISYKLF